LLLGELDGSAELITIHKEANHRIMHEHGCGETNGFVSQPLDPCSQCQMFAFDLLRVDFADGVGRSGKMALIDARCIRVAVLQPNGLEQLLQLNKNRIRATPERIR
jgi:hypothetical protein